MQWKAWLLARPESRGFVRRFGPRVAVNVGADRVTFTRGVTTVPMLPRVEVDDRDIVVSVGARGIEVFAERDSGRREQLLRVLFTHGLRLVLGGSLTIRPFVRVTLQTGLTSHDEIANALRGAGAGDVEAAD
jgi:hypothetical protein